MKKIIIFGIIFLLLGLLIGYFIFAKVGNSYVSVKNLLGLSKGPGRAVLNKVLGIKKIRTNILFSGLAGLAIGIGIGAIKKK